MSLDSIKKSVVITGCGVVASNAIGRDAFGKALAQGKSGLGDLVSFDASDLGRERAGEILDFEVETWLRTPKNFLDRNSALAFAACEMAVRESGLELPDADRKGGIGFGSMSGNLETLTLFDSNVRKKGPRFAPPFLFPHTYYNATAGLLSIEYGLGGPHEQFCSGGVAGMEAIASAACHIAEGRTEVMIAGGAEAFTEPLFRMAVSRGWVSPTDGGVELCRPFADDCNGTILGEGAAMFVLESEHHAAARGATILGRISGTGMGTFAQQAVLRAMANAGLKTDGIDLVVAAACGHPQHDREEAGAVVGVFRGHKKPIVAIKSLIGETLGASGPLNLAAALCTPHETILVNAADLGQGRWVSVVLG